MRTFFYVITHLFTHVIEDFIVQTENNLLLADQALKLLNLLLKKGRAVLFTFHLYDLCNHWIQARVFGDPLVNGRLTDVVPTANLENGEQVTV